MRALDSSGLRVDLLGPLRVSYQGRALETGPIRQKALLAVLALRANRVCSPDELLDTVWEDRLPSSGVKIIPPYIYRIRKLLPLDDLLERTRDGYVLRLPPESVDVERFENAVRTAADPADYARALELFRGEPLAGLPGHWLASQRTRLEERRYKVLGDKIALDLDRGRHVEAVAELATAAEERPMDERLAGQLMLALSRSGRQAEALDHYRQVRETLVEQLAVEPGPELRAIHQQILQHDATPSKRDDLPYQDAIFVGRETELEIALSALTQSGRTAPPVVTIDGMGGAGKTALAVRIARDLADSYPEGRLFLDLHGHTPGREPLGVSAAVDHLLATIGVQAGRIPSTIDERLALWRSEVADRRVLVVLDNAPNSQVVRALLPGSLTCGVLVTSRRQLVGLDAGIRIALDVLTAEQAGDLLAQVVGAPQTVGHEQASVELAERCGHLPLAIRIAGSRLRHRPSWTVEYLNSKLAAEDHRLDELSVDGRGVASAFAVSYEQLGAEEQLMFRRLSLMPGRDADQFAAAALAGLAADKAEQILEELVDANLLLQLSPGRFQFHDLVRQYAAELCARTDSDTDRAAGTNRLIDYYVQTGRRAATRRRIDHLEGHPEFPPVDGWTFDSLQDAVGWAAHEGGNLLAVLHQAKVAGRDDAVLQLAVSLAPFLHQHGRLDDYETMLAEGLSTAQQLGDVEAEGRIELVYGRLLNVRKGPRPALPHLLRAAELVASSTDSRLRALVLTGLAYVGGRYDLASDWESMIAEAIRLAQAIGDPKVEIGALEAAAVLHGDRMDWTDSLNYYQRTLDKCREVGDEEVVADLLNGMAECELALGRPAEALEKAMESKEHALRLGLSHALSLTYSFIGTAYVDLGEYDLAVQAHREAVETALRSGIRRSLVIARLRLGGSLLAAGRRGDSRHEFLATLELAKAEHLDNHIARAYVGLADCAEAEGIPEHAVALLDQAIEAAGDQWSDLADDLRSRQRTLLDRQQPA